MPSRSVDLTPEQDAFVADEVAAGRYRNANEVLRAAVTLLQRRWTSDDAVLRADLAAGLASIERGEYFAIADENLDQALDDLATMSGP